MGLSATHKSDLPRSKSHCEPKENKTHDEGYGNLHDLSEAES